MSEDDTSYRLSDGGNGVSKDDTSGDDTSLEGFDSDESFESNTNYSFEKQYNNNII